MAQTFLSISLLLLLLDTTSAFKCDAASQCNVQVSDFRLSSDTLLRYVFFRILFVSHHPSSMMDEPFLNSNNNRLLSFLSPPSSRRPKVWHASHLVARNPRTRIAPASAAALITPAGPHAATPATATSRRAKPHAQHGT